MRLAGRAQTGDCDAARREITLPNPTPQFRRRAWREFQRALDPLAPPRPLSFPQQR